MTEKLSTYTLGVTLHEIYTALHAQEGVQKTLVPNFSGRRVYDRRVGWGLVYHFFFRYAVFLGRDSEKVRQQLTARALWRVHLASKEHITLWLQLIGELQLALENLCDGFSTSSEKYEQVRYLVCSCQAAYLPFYRLAIGSHQVALKNLFESTSAGPHALENSAWWLWLNDKEKKVIIYFCILLSKCVERIKQALNTFYVSKSASVEANEVEKETTLLLDAVDNLEEGDLFAANKLIDAVDKYLPIIDLERAMGETWPVEELAHLAWGKKMSDAATFRLRQWSERLSQSKYRGVESLWRPALMAFRQLLLEHPRRHKEVDIKTVGELESFLSDCGMAKFLERDDLKHLQWRSENLKAGSVLWLGEERIELVAQIGKKKGERDCHQLFTMRERPNQLLCTASNCSSLTLQQWRQWQRQGGMESAAILEVHASGRWAVVEKLTEPLSECKWTTTGVQLTPRDSEFLTPLCNQISWFLKHESMPDELSAKYLLFDMEKGILKSCRLKTVVPLDWFKLERLMYEVAGRQQVKGKSLPAEDTPESQAVFSILMRKSGLEEHPVAVYWRTLVAEGCFCQEDTGELAAIRGIQSDQYIQHGAKLLRKLEEARRCCREQLLGYSQPGDADFERKLSTCLKMYCGRSLSASELPPNLVHLVTSSWSQFI